MKKISEWWFQLKKFGRECRRVMKVTQKPNREEFLTIAKVSALGMGIIGLIGFVLSMVQQLILSRV
ncbi:protein translocase SEC61 complex subunit gamma [Candidatus Woesearchaeota archaeon]|nr:protein translocase SEC61 complex subunit gamma [Candidatus Woesearchaeota archaeon]